ncbi:MAG: ATP-binding protein [Bacteroidia bacterium]
MIQRIEIAELTRLLKTSPAVALLGARQIGKTTLAKLYASKSKKQTLYLDLELESHFNRLQNDAESYLLKNKDKLIIIDEVQRMPKLFALLRALIDIDRKPARFLLLGSSSPHLIKGVSESLAGRIAYLDMGGINLAEALKSRIKQDVLWFKGGFPVALKLKQNRASQDWYNSLIKSYTEKDMSELFGTEFSAVIIRNFWSMLAHNNGSVWNKENYAKSLGVTAPTVGRYLEYMEGAFLLTRLQPWFFNSKKRLVKAPKIYIRDSGILHTLVKTADMDELAGHPAIGPSWEGFVLEQIRQLKPPHLDMYFYRTHQGAEADIVLVKGAKPIACIEIKLSTAPQVSKGFYQCVEDLKTNKNYVLIPSGDSYNAADNVVILSLSEFISMDLARL